MDQPSFDLTGAVALVTGAGRGIGRDLAVALAGAGATVVSGVRAGDAPTEPVTIDLREVASIRAAVDDVVERHGKLDVLVNNAGLGTNHDALDATEDEWDDLMAVNLRGLFFACQAAGRHMVERGYGRIVNMSSQAGHVGIPRHAAYSASKGGVELLTKVLALEWGASGVTVNAVAPTFVRTPGTAERLDDPAFRADVVSRIPVGRVGTTSEVAAAVIFLASPAASLVNGTSIVVDGGWTAQ
ncbi:MAG TPA: SDR family oxidoreductase [Gaiellaceae bacterium]|nr:SDR family oxidoreductase [Gaiellaceae bacterium]